MSCPHCGSKSGVDVHNRGFCHACKKDFDNKRSIFKEIKTDLQEAIERRRLGLPIIDSYDITPREKDYLLKYGLFGKDIKKYGIFHSIKYNRLCFPYYVIRSQLLKKKRMIGCWMRSVDGTDPKWLYAGEDKNSYIWRYHLDINDPQPLCLVEDVISAIRVSKFMDCVCLGGTYVSKDSQLFSLVKQYSELVLFLDGDSAGLKAAQRIRNQFKLDLPVRIIRAAKDPKEYTDEQLSSLLYDR